MRWLDAVTRFLSDAWDRVSEAGFHHLLVAAAFSAPAALLSLQAWAALALWWSGYYWAREDGFEQLKGDYTAGGRLRDVVFVWIYALFSVLVTLFLETGGLS